MARTLARRARIAVAAVVVAEFAAAVADIGPFLWSVTGETRSSAAMRRLAVHEERALVATRVFEVLDRAGLTSLREARLA